jgi:hypothetical protein
VRISVFGKLFVDDYFFLLALAILISSAIVLHFMIPAMYTLVLVQLGRVKPTSTILDTATLFMKYQLTTVILFWSCLWSVKGSFLAFFYGLTRNLKSQRIMWYAVTTFTVIAYIGCIISNELSCSSFNAGKSSLLLQVFGGINC